MNLGKNLSSDRGTFNTYFPLTAIHKNANIDVSSVVVDFV
jgi:hypothetical protein